jgi:excisionase family DNA binding protein
MPPAHYTIAEAASIVGVDRAQIERWLRSGVLTASERRGRQRLLSFADLVAAKTARELSLHGATERALRQNLAALRAKLPALDRPLQRMRVVSDGEQLVVVEGEVAFEALSGQVVMDFVVGALSTRAAEVLALPTSAPPLSTPPPAPSAPVPPALPMLARFGGESAWAVFMRASEADSAGLWDEARAGYEAALAMDPQLAVAHTNIGILEACAGHKGAARERYELALALDPDQPEARSNLACLLAAMGEPAATDRAIAEWTRVTATQPDFADAHYNLGVALAGRDMPFSAAAALERYLALEPRGFHAEAATELLAEVAARAAISNPTGATGSNRGNKPGGSRRA